MKKVVLLTILFFVFSPVFSASVSSSKVDAANSKMLYFKYEFFKGLTVVSDSSPFGYQVHGDEFKIMISKVPSAYTAYQESVNKSLLSTAVIIGGELVGLGVMYYGLYTLWGSAYSYSANIPMVAGGSIVMIIASIAGGMLQMEAENLLYKTIHEYNKEMISAGMRADGTVGIQKNIGF